MNSSAHERCAAADLAAEREEKFRRAMTPEREWLGEQLLFQRWVAFDNLTTAGKFRQPNTLVSTIEQMLAWRDHTRRHHPKMPALHLRARNLRTGAFIIVE